MFFNVNGALHRVLLKVDDGIWAISYDNPAAPCYISEAQFSLYERVPAPSEYLDRARDRFAKGPSGARRAASAGRYVYHRFRCQAKDSVREENYGAPRTAHLLLFISQDHLRR